MTRPLSGLWRSRAGWTVIALAMGTALGLLAPGLSRQLDWIAHGFIRLVQSAIAPLVIASLVAGIAEVPDMRTLGGLAGKTLVLFFTITALALCIGALSSALLQPGRTAVGVMSPLAGKPPVPGAKPPASFVDQLIPSSITAAVTEGNLLQIVVFASLFGVACLIAGPAADPVVAFCKSVTAAMLHYTDLIMYIAPFAVAAAIAGAVAAHGADALESIARLLIAFFLAQVVLILFVLTPLAWLAGVPVLRFLSAVKEPALLAFSTTSSAAALPVALRNMELFGVPGRVAAFTIPLGLSLNLVGTCVYLGVTVLFCIQYSGSKVSAQTVMLMLGTLLVTSKGLTGVPRSAMVALVGVLDTFGIANIGVALVLGVDVIMDMTRTAVNVGANCLAAAAVGRWQERIYRK